MSSFLFIIYLQFIILHSIWDLYVNEHDQKQLKKHILACDMMKENS